MKDMYDYYYNVETEEGTCVAPKGVVPKTSWLTGEEIQVGGWNIGFYCKSNISIWESVGHDNYQEAVVGETEGHFISICFCQEQQLQSKQTVIAQPPVQCLAMI